MRRKSICFVLVSLLILSLAAIHTFGKKPVKPDPTPADPAISFNADVTVRKNLFRSDLWVMNADGEAKTLLRKGPEYTDRFSHKGYYHPSFSPFGDKLVVGFVNPGTRCTGSEIRAMELSIENNIPAVAREWTLVDCISSLSELGVDEAYLPCWSPDGTRIAFSTGKQICVAPFKDTTLAPADIEVIYDVTVDEDPTEGVHVNVYFPTWNPSSSKIAFMRQENQPEPGRRCHQGILLANLDPTKGCPIVELMPPGIYSGCQPTWSNRSEDLIAFLGPLEDSNERTQIRLMTFQVWCNPDDSYDVSKEIESLNPIERVLDVSWLPDDLGMVISGYIEWPNRIFEVKFGNPPEIKELITPPKRNNEQYLYPNRRRCDGNVITDPSFCNP
ncbi:hypothetical protein ACFLU6_11795 [Acidobacteriota bacterium]